MYCKEEENGEPVIGEIYKGRVKNIVPATNSIFVDLGLNKGGFFTIVMNLKLEALRRVKKS